MCGITGFIHRRGDASPERLDRMINSMFHRGPDGEGRFVDAPVAVGMRRLAIIDPKGGQQPFSTRDGQVVALLNGEIYNYRTLRKELEQRGIRFETDSDTEVLPHAFRLFGPDEFARRLDGMFGIVIVDRAARRLHLFRDRYGEKPVFYSSDADRFAFASQLTTLTLESDFDFKVDPIALRHYLFLHSVPGPRTIFESIRRLLPGCRLSVSFDGNEAPEISDWARGAKPEIEVPRRFEEAVDKCGRVSTQRSKAA